MTTIRLLGRIASINVRKVMWVCDELDLDCVREDWGIGFKPLDTPEYRALNPNALVPVISDGDFVLWESNAIIRYLANAYGAQKNLGLYPASPRERARIDQWMDWQATDLNRAWTYAFMGVTRSSPDHTDPAQIAASWKSWTEKLAILDARLAETGAYAAGLEFSLADIVLGLSVHRWRSTPLDHADLPHIAAYYERLSQRPGFAAVTTVP